MRMRVDELRTCGEKLRSKYDLVERMDYLYVQVVKAKDLPINNLTGTCDPFIEVKLGNYKALTSNLKKTSNPEWNQVFAFLKDRIQSTHLEVIVKDSNFVKEDFMGRISFDLSHIRERVPPDSPLVAEWYKLRDMERGLVEGEVMLAVWMGTQADEAFSGAWCSDAAVRSKVYLSPKLWYLRVNVIQAQDLILTNDNRVPRLFGKVVFGNQVLSTKEWKNQTVNPYWNEDLMFVAAEPSEELLTLCVENKVAEDKVEVLGRCVIPLQMVDRRLDHKPILSRWYRLMKYVSVDGGKKKDVMFAGRIHVRICLEGGYHVIDEPTHYISDLRPTAKQLWKPSVGVLELGILNAYWLLPMKRKDGRGTTDAYCVAKYGRKWVRTRTITDSVAPRWNEQYSWEVFDQCTVITIGVYDNCRFQEGDRSKEAEDGVIGKRNTLRREANQIVCMRLSCAEPPLRKEVVEYMMDVHSYQWSIRRSKVNFDRVMDVLGGLIALNEWFEGICNWKNPFSTVLIHGFFIILVLDPELILPIIFLYLSFIGWWYYKFRPKHPPHVDIRISHVDRVHPDDLDEDFDTLPTDMLRMKYDRVVGDLATQGERLQSLLSWRDPRATFLFLVFCHVATIVFYFATSQMLVLFTGLYLMRHPRFRLMSLPLNFFKRLPARTDTLL